MIKSMNECFPDSQEQDELNLYSVDLQVEEQIQVDLLVPLDIFPSPSHPSSLSLDLYNHYECTELAKNYILYKFLFI